MSAADSYVEQLRRELEEHADDPQTGVCRKCGRDVCARWIEAGALLALAGQCRDEVWEVAR